MSIASGIIKGVSAAMRAVGGDITLVRFTEGTYDQIEQNENVREIYLGKSDA